MAERADRKNRQKEIEINWVYGEQHGNTIAWHDNGKLKTKSKWLNGKLEGKCTNWYINGVKKEEITLQRGIPIGIAQTWYRNGKISGEITFNNGLCMSAKKWKPNGHPCLITNLAEGNGVTVSYDDQGNQVKTFKYKNGIQIDELGNEKNSSAGIGN